MGLTGAGGVVLERGGRVTGIGRVPDPPVDWRAMRGALHEGVAMTDRLSETVALDHAQREAAAGAAYLELSGDGRDILALPRPHYVHTIPWAGRPEKREVREADGTTRLSPRGSFALWCEERRGLSRPYDETDREVLRILRRALVAINSLEREREAVAARRAAEAEEERLRLALLEASRRTAMGELASALAHELNQPLAAVTNYVNACRQELRNRGAAVPGEADAIMAEAVGEARRAADLVRRLRDLIADGTVAAEETDLGAAIRQGVDLALVAERGAAPELRWEIEPDLPPVWADPVQIAQVVLNLARNAVAAMRESPAPVLTVAAWRAGGEVRVSVRDTGPGVPPGRRAGLFEAFQRSTTGGMGIGLSLCRSIVEAHGGWIRHDDPGVGAAFTFALRAGAGNGGR
jgi:signal transduction histidine kinase